MTLQSTEDAWEIVRGYAVTRTNDRVKNEIEAVGRIKGFLDSQFWLWSVMTQREGQEGDSIAYVATVFIERRMVATTATGETEYAALVRATALAIRDEKESLDRFRTDSGS